MEKCENCGRVIGNLETPLLHQEHVVCAQCWDRLQPVKTASAPTVPIRPTVDRSRIPPWRRSASNDKFSDFDSKVKYVFLAIILAAIVIWLVWGDISAYLRVHEFNSGN
jgi:hypothetical protein